MLRAGNPEQPWTYDYDWPFLFSKDESPNKLVAAGAFVVICTLFTAISFDLGYNTKHDSPFVYSAWFLLLMTGTISCWAAKLLARHLKYGRGRIDFDAMPLQIGKPIHCH